MLNISLNKSLALVQSFSFNKFSMDNSSIFRTFIIQLLDETEQNIVIYQWRADQLFADAEGSGK